SRRSPISRTRQHPFRPGNDKPYQKVFLLVSRPRDSRKERSIRLLIFFALLPQIESGIRNSGKVTRGLLIATLLDEFDNLIREFVVELRWSALFHFSSMFSTEASSASTAE